MMSTVITHFFGQAMTGQGVKHVYKDIMNEAKTVYLLKGAYGFKISELLQQLGSYYHGKGFDIDYFYDPLFEHIIEAIFIKAPHPILILQATNPAIEPIDLDARDHVISLKDCVDVQKLVFIDDFISLNQLKQTYYEKCFALLSKAIQVHDEWEVETRKNMNWSGLDQQFAELTNHLFGMTTLEKPAALTHRLLGTLTPRGARDTVQSITQNLEKRLFIKGFPGTGKSSMMKKLANEALSRGFDVQLVWCGLDSNSIDMVILPELTFCIFDSTEPHVYFPDENRPGDELFDIAKHCDPSEVEQKNIEKISVKYKEVIAEATKFAALFANEERKVREVFDAALNIEEFNERVKILFALVD